jgi:hypothetical protein
MVFFIESYSWYIFNLLCPSCHAYIGNFNKKWLYVPTNSNPDSLSITTIKGGYYISNTSISFKSDFGS